MDVIVFDISSRVGLQLSSNLICLDSSYSFSKPERVLLASFFVGITFHTKNNSTALFPITATINNIPTPTHTKSTMNLHVDKTMKDMK